MTFFYEYRESIEQCENILNENFTKLYNYVEYRRQSSNSTEFTELDEKYANVKTYFDTARANIEKLKIEFKDLTEHYSVLFVKNFAAEFPNYVERQEPLRLKLIEAIFECQNLQMYFENVDNSSLDKDFSSNGRNFGPECYKRISQLKRGVNDAIFQNGRYLKHATVSFSSCNVSKAAVMKELESSNEVLIVPSTETNKSLSRFKERRKAIVCDICDKNFSTKQNLDEHSVIHRGLKPFICSICDKSFARKRNLANHIHLIHESYRYSCSKCDRSFLLKSTKEKHERIAHL